MTSWAEAIEQYRKEKAKAEKRKAERDDKAWLLKWQEENGPAQE